MAKETCPNCGEETYFLAVMKGDCIEGEKQIFPRNIIRHTCPSCLRVVRESNNKIGGN